MKPAEGEEDSEDSEKVGLIPANYVEEVRFSSSVSPASFRYQCRLAVDRKLTKTYYTFLLSLDPPNLLRPSSLRIHFHFPRRTLHPRRCPSRSLFCRFRMASRSSLWFRRRKRKRKNRIRSWKLYRTGRGRRRT